MQRSHHTSSYSWSNDVYRRGFPFSFSCHCGNPENISDFYVSVKTGRNYSRNLTREFKVTKGYEVNGWTVNYELSNRSDMIIVTVTSSPSAIIGQYNLNVMINGRYYLSKKFLLFFNPWCKDDSVYIDDENMRQEYVMNTNTIIYMGTQYHVSPRHWYVGQFQWASIESALNILDLMNVDERNSPIKVSRHLSALVNSNDDNGVLLGNWSGNYAGGTSPNAWTGSHQILIKYARYRAPVRFAQCWVYCGVLCTLLRTCGLPSRCVTNYNSFHDSDGSCIWEMYFNRYLRPIYFRRKESMWNFHCWNEAWMDRTDLVKGYGGWQIVDSTPQERSEGRFKLGPASQVAVKEGMTEMKYDTGFVFAEVNADRIYYYQMPKGGFRIGKIDSYTVGKNISTKRVGSNGRQDITSSYKYPDNSVTERIIQGKILHKNKKTMFKSHNTVKTEIKCPGIIPWNENFDIWFKLTNTTKSHITVKFRISCVSITYRGRVKDKLLSELYESSLKGQEVKEFSERITPAQLRKTINKDYSFIKTTITGVTSTEQFIYVEEVTEIDPPRISIHGYKGSLRANTKHSLTISVKNPLDRTITGTKIYLSGEPIMSGKRKITAGSIESGKTYESTFEVYSKKKGNYYIYATLSANEISGLETHISMNFD